MDENFHIFSEDGPGQQIELDEMMRWMTEAVEQGNVDMRQVIDVLIDLVRPGTSEHSHDVRLIWTTAMHTLGYRHVADKVGAMYLNSMPWGLGFHIGVEPGFHFEQLPDDAKHAVVQAMCVTINMGGLNAEMTPEGTIRITHEDGETNDISADDLIGQFRQEIEAELGPDADDPLHRWGLY